MRRDKTIARFLLVFSVANIALAAPAVVRQRHVDVAEAASGRRDNTDDKTTDGSGAQPVPEPVPESDEPRLSTDSGSGPNLGSQTRPSGSSHPDSPGSFHEGSVSSIYPPYFPFGDPNSPTYRGSAPPSPATSESFIYPGKDSTTSHYSAHSPPPTWFHGVSAPIYPPWYPFGDPNSPTYRGSAPLSPASSESSLNPGWWSGDKDSTTSHDSALALPPASPEGSEPSIDGSRYLPLASSPASHGSSELAVHSDWSQDSALAQPLLPLASHEIPESAIHSDGSQDSALAKPPASHEIPESALHPDGSHDSALALPPASHKIPESSIDGSHDSALALPSGLSHQDSVTKLPLSNSFKKYLMSSPKFILSKPLKKKLLVVAALSSMVVVAASVDLANSHRSKSS